MTPYRSLRRLPLLLPLILGAACATEGRPVRVSGAESDAAVVAARGAQAGGVAVRTQAVPAAFVRTRDGARFELVTTDGVAMTGTLREEREPVIVPLSAAPGAPPLVGGGVLLVGDIAGGGASMACRFRLLNPVRGVDGGGSGRCEGAGRQVEFVF